MTRILSMVAGSFTGTGIAAATFGHHYLAAFILVLISVFTLIGVIVSITKELNSNV